MKISLQLQTQQLIAAYRAEARRYQKLADDLAEELNQGEDQIRIVSPKGDTGNHGGSEPQEGSFLTLALQVLREKHKPMHIKEVVKSVEELRGEPVKRVQVESALVRGMKSAKHGIQRTAPGVFAVLF